jgi:hypothetical protein
MKKCGYRRCENKVEGVHKFYCCRRCKNSEAVYRLRDNKPKGKVGRPKHVYKRLSDITDEDRRILEIVLRNTKTM